MKRLKFSLTILALAIFAMLQPNPSFAEIEKAEVKIEGGMQCSLWSYAVNKTLLRQDGVADSNTSLETQSSTVIFKKGRVIDFGKLAKAVDGAGFKAGEIKIWAQGTVQEADGQLSFKVSGSNQTFPVKGEQAAKLKGLSGKEVKVVGKLEFEKKPLSLIVESVE